MIKEQLNKRTIKRVEMVQTQGITVIKLERQQERQGKRQQERQSYSKRTNKKDKKDKKDKTYLEINKKLKLK